MNRTSSEAAFAFNVSSSYRVFFMKIFSFLSLYAVSWSFNDLFRVYLFFSKCHHPNFYRTSIPTLVAEITVVRFPADVFSIEQPFLLKINYSRSSFLNFRVFLDVKIVLNFFVIFFTHKFDLISFCWAFDFDSLDRFFLSIWNYKRSDFN